MTHQPIGAWAEIAWLDTPNETMTMYFSFGDYVEEYEVDSNGIRDDEIFFYCDNGESSLKSFMTEGAESFILISYILRYNE